MKVEKQLSGYYGLKNKQVFLSQSHLLCFYFKVILEWIVKSISTIVIRLRVRMAPSVKIWWWPPGVTVWLALQENSVR